MPAVAVSNLTRSYGDVLAVDDLSFTVEPGEVFALLGPNGAGKSTTLEILEGHRSRDGGSVDVLGRDPGDGDRELRDRIGIVLQEVGIERELTVREVLEHYGACYTRRRPVDEVLALVGLDGLGDRRTHRMSGGQKRRIDLATGLIGDPDLLFLDEPTTGLDPTSRQALWEEVRRLNTEYGTTVFLTTQYLEEADQLADRIAIIDAGRLVREGTPEVLKGSVGAPTLRIDVAQGSVETARVVLCAFGPDRPAREGRVAIGLDGGAARVADVVRALDGAGVVVDHLELDAPSLDDVFAEATGRRLEGAGEEL